MMFHRLKTPLYLITSSPLIVLWLILEITAMALQRIVKRLDKTTRRIEEILEQYRDKIWGEDGQH